MSREEEVESGAWRQLLVEEARTWKFTPYQHRGRVKGVGVDCGGLLYELYGIWFGPLPAFPADYPPDWAVHREDERYLNFIMPYTRQVTVPVIGGFSVFRYGANFSHAAIYTEKGTYIHAWGATNGGSVRESKPEFFRLKGGGPRAVKHFDVSK